MRHQSFTSPPPSAWATTKASRAAPAALAAVAAALAAVAAASVKTAADVAATARAATASVAAAAAGAEALATAAATAAGASAADIAKAGADAAAAHILPAGLPTGFVAEYSLQEFTRTIGGAQHMLPPEVIEQLYHLFNAASAASVPGQPSLAHWKAVENLMRSSFYVDPKDG